MGSMSISVLPMQGVNLWPYLDRFKLIKCAISSESNDALITLVWRYLSIIMISYKLKLNKTRKMKHI